MHLVQSARKPYPSIRGQVILGMLFHTLGQIYLPHPNAALLYYKAKLRGERTCTQKDGRERRLVNQVCVILADLSGAGVLL